MYCMTRHSKVQNSHFCLVEPFAMFIATLLPMSLIGFN